MSRIRYKGIYSPDAYTRLILEALRGNQSAFVRSDELLTSWKIFSPLLHDIEENQQAAKQAEKKFSRYYPIIYPYGSRGPNEAEEFIKSMGMCRTIGYQWIEPQEEKT